METKSRLREIEMDTYDEIEGKPRERERTTAGRYPLESKQFSLQKYNMNILLT